MLTKEQIADAAGQLYQAEKDRVQIKALTQAFEMNMEDAYAVQKDWIDRKLADKRTFPAIDVGKSGTRKEELLVDKGALAKMWLLRRILMPMGTTDSMDFLLDKLKQTKNNDDFFQSMNQ